MSFSAEQRAFLVAVPVTSFVTSCSFVLVPMLVGSEDLPEVSLLEMVQFVATYTVVSLPLVALAGVFIGLPAVLVLRQLNWLTLPVLIVAGAFAGAIGSALVLWPFVLQPTIDLLLADASIGVLPGILAAYIWWRLAEQPLSEDRLNV